MSETIKGQAVEDMEPGTAMVVSESHRPAPVTLFGTDDPAGVVRRAAETARPLADVVRQQKLATNIHGREHVRVEGWTLLGSMLGVFPVCVWTRKMEDGWEARVEARTRDGAVVGAAEAECLRSESTWKSRDDYALRSMAQTRATSKALRQPLGFVMQLAGFDPTPLEEMPKDSARGAATARAEQPGGELGGASPGSQFAYEPKATPKAKEALRKIAAALIKAKKVTEAHIVTSLGFDESVPLKTALDHATQVTVVDVTECLVKFAESEQKLAEAQALADKQGMP